MSRITQRAREKECERLERDLEHDFKVANYLMIAHGAALFACVTLLKDYKAIPELKGIGIFVFFFGFGFLFASLSYAGTRVIRAAFVAQILNIEPRIKPPVWQLYIAIVGMGISYFLLIGAVIWLVLRLMWI